MLRDSEILEMTFSPSQEDAWQIIFLLNHTTLKKISALNFKQTTRSQINPAWMQSATRLTLQLE